MVKRSGRKHTHRKQRGGSSPYTGGYGNYGYTGPAGVAAGGVPFDSRTINNGNCGWDLRVAPQVVPTGVYTGGRRSRTRKQKGGSCGCGVRNQMGGGSGNGGHMNVFNNDLIGKLYPIQANYACPATAPVATNIGNTPLYKMGGGSADAASYRDLAATWSSRAGYGFDPSSVVSTNSAHYLLPNGYAAGSCMGGARRTHKKHGKKHGKNRKKHGKRS